MLAVSMPRTSGQPLRPEVRLLALPNQFIKNKKEKRVKTKNQQANIEGKEELLQNI